MPSYFVNADLGGFVEQLRLHFWSRGNPEKFILNKEVARISHGAHIVGLVYTEGVRTMWYHINPGQHVNDDPDDQKNPYPILLIITKVSSMLL